MRGNLLLVTLVTISGLCSASSSGESHASTDPEKLQSALYQIESGHLSDPDNARGAAGEVSRYQILPSVWKHYAVHRNYADANAAWSVARRILADRCKLFTEGAGRDPAPFDIYVMWNKPSLYQKCDFKKQRLPHSVREKADRFANLVSVTSTLARN